MVKRKWSLLTFIAQVLKFGTVVILVEDEDVELADAYEGVRRLVCGRHCYCILSLPLPIKRHSSYNNTWKSTSVTIELLFISYVYSQYYRQFNFVVHSKVASLFNLVWKRNEIFWNQANYLDAQQICAKYSFIFVLEFRVSNLSTAPNLHLRSHRKRASRFSHCNPFLFSLFILLYKRHTDWCPMNSYIS